MQTCWDLLNPCLHAWAQVGATEQVERLLIQLRSHGIKEDIYTYAMRMDAHRYHGNYVKYAHTCWHTRFICIPMLFCKHACKIAACNAVAVYIWQPLKFTALAYLPSELTCVVAPCHFKRTIGHSLNRGNTGNDGAILSTREDLHAPADISVLLLSARMLEQVHVQG